MTQSNNTRDESVVNLTVKAQLPSLKLNFSEDKIIALMACIKANTPSRPSSTSATQPVSPAPTQPPKTRESGSEPEPAAAVVVSSKTSLSKRLMLFDFLVDDVSVTLFSTRKTLSKLIGVNILGMNGQLCARPYDRTISFEIATILVADYLQPPNTPFHHLISTAKHMDSDAFISIQYIQFMPCPPRLVCPLDRHRFNDDRILTFESQPNGRLLLEVFCDLFLPPLDF